MSMRPRLMMLLGIKTTHAPFLPPSPPPIPAELQHVPWLNKKNCLLLCGFVSGGWGGKGVSQSALIVVW